MIISDRKIHKVAGASVIALGLFIGGAGAADLSVEQAANWDRFYVGGNIGASWAKGVDNSSNDFRGNEQGFTSGLQIGRNWQTENFVWGVEADFGLGGLAWTGDETDEDNALSADVVSSLRARLGLNAGNHLFYVTAGAGMLRGEGFSSSGASEGEGSKSDWNFRPVVGLGMESMVTPSMSLKVEGLAFIGSEDYLDDLSLETVGVVRTGVNFFFGAPGGAEIGQTVASPEWNRFYMGGNLGANVAQAYDNSSGEFFRNEHGMSGGLQIGANFHGGGDFVWGVEADANTGGLNWGADSGHQLDILAVGSLRGRLGIAVDNHLIYATAGGGLIWGEGLDSSSDQDDDKVVFRPVVGIGIESMITERISLKAEGLAWIGEDKFQWHPSCNCSSQGVMDTLGTIRLGVNFHM